MHLSTKTHIAGQPAIKVRDFLRKTDGGLWDAAFARNYFNVTENKAQSLINNLAENKYISKNRLFNADYWTATEKGNQLALATATKGILRPNAEKILQDFLKRVKQVNEGDYFLYRVTKVAVFGSFLDAERDRINDIDLLVQIAPKIQDNEKHWQMSSKRIEDAERQGRRFSNFTERLGWAETEVWMFLKNRSSALSLHCNATT